MSACRGDLQGPPRDRLTPDLCVIHGRRGRGGRGDGQTGIDTPAASQMLDRSCKALNRDDPDAFDGCRLRGVFGR